MSTCPSTFEEVMKYALPYLRKGEEMESLGLTHLTSEAYEHGYYHAMFAGAFMQVSTYNRRPKAFDFKRLRRLLNIFDHRYIVTLLKLGFYGDVKALTDRVLETRPLELTMTEKFDFLLCKILAYLGLGDVHRAMVMLDSMWHITDGVKTLYTSVVGNAWLDNVDDIFGRLYYGEEKMDEIIKSLVRLTLSCGGDLGEPKIDHQLFYLEPWTAAHPWLSLPKEQAWSKIASKMQHRKFVESAAGIDMTTLQLNSWDPHDTDRSR
ncbi:MAG: hypothetical protein Q9164_007418 [Protoblastenia rupestris]